MTVVLGQLFLSKTKNPSLKYGLSPGGNAEQQWWWLGLGEGKNNLELREEDSSHLEKIYFSFQILCH